MNEQVRSNLSEKKKIKDLFLVVIRSVEIYKNKKLISSLIQFISNLCYGAGKLRTMLANEDSKEFFATLRTVLDQIKIENKLEVDEDDQENLNPEKIKQFAQQEYADKSLLKNTLYAFIGNLLVDK